MIARPIMTHRWRWLTFLHWGYAPEVIQRSLPPNLRVDTFNGQAWIGLVPFVLSDLRSPSLPPIPWISGFPETNVRTYVKAPDGESGVWFFTLEADRLIAVLGARLVYRLPYRWASMKVWRIGEQVHYRSRRLPPFGAARTDVTIQPGPQLSPVEFDHFLTARFRLYTAFEGRIGCAEIEHTPWPPGERASG